MDKAIIQSQASTLTVQESTAISWLRVLAMLSIVTCHFMQALNNHWAWVFNIGVQIFLLMSGFLFGYRHVNNWRSWFLKRFIRIYIPFILFFISVVPLYAANHLITYKNIVVYVVDLQGVMGGARGLSHLWFLTAIALCYAITPLLQCAKRYSKWMISVIAVVGIIIFWKIPVIQREVSWFILYALGYYMASVGSRVRLGIGLVFTTIMVWLLFHFSWESMMSASGSWSLGFHISGAIIVFLLFLFFFKQLNFNKVPTFIKALDKYSFHIYIVHHILIMKPFGLLNLTDHLVLNCVVILSYIALFSWGLMVASEKTTAFFELEISKLEEHIKH